MFNLLNLVIMCGIVGYIGKNQALPILMDGLKKLEYRGYDSSGVALLENNQVFNAKAVGKILELEKKLKNKTNSATMGIAHTRWATHGSPTETNSHPHTDDQGQVWLVHNGIIENYQQLRKKLQEKGHSFVSETDSEVIAHLIADLYEGDLLLAVQRSLHLLKGAYGIVVFHKNEPNRLIAARQGSPLVLGLGEQETILASDVSAIIRHTRQVIYLEDGEIADLKENTFNILNANNQKIDKQIQELEWNIDQAEKGGFAHFMLKEIYEQPETILTSLRGRLLPEEGKVKLGGLEDVKDKLRDVQQLHIVACGTAYYAGKVGAQMIEEYAGIPCYVEFASEYRYKKPLIDKNTAVLAISQSGETADTLAAIREAKEKGALTLGIINTVGSTIARENDAGVYNHIGPEIAVASTKAFTSQVTILALMTVLFGRQRTMSLATGQRIIRELQKLPDLIQKTLEQEQIIQTIAKKYYQTKNFAFIGRKYNHALAYEGALKLKEISYIHAEGFPAGEMKHGHIALIDQNFPSLCIAPSDSVYEKNISNIEEIKSRGGQVIAITTQGNQEITQIADEVIYIPKTLEMLTPILTAIPLQLFAYYMAILNNRDVDKPRNLAKSVTVE